MFPQVHLKEDDEGSIVLHPHVNRVTDGVETDLIGILIVCSVYGIVQGQRPLFVLRILLFWRNGKGHPSVPIYIS